MRAAISLRGGSLWGCQLPATHRHVGAACMPACVPPAETHSAFTGAIASLSLAGPAVVVLRREGQRSRALFLPPRSLVLMAGARVPLCSRCFAWVRPACVANGLSSRAPGRPADTVAACRAMPRPAMPCRAVLLQCLSTLDVSAACLLLAHAPSRTSSQARHGIAGATTFPTASPTPWRAPARRCPVPLAASPSPSGRCTAVATCPACAAFVHRAEAGLASLHAPKSVWRLASNSSVT